MVNGAVGSFAVLFEYKREDAEITMSIVLSPSATPILNERARAQDETSTASI